jgi:predicted nucleic acid-binding protein
MSAFKPIFLDANVVIDFLSQRQPFFDEALLLFTAIDAGLTKAYTSGISILVAHYILRKVVSEAEARRKLKELMDLLTVISVTPAILQQALSSDIKDYEDAAQAACAMTIGSIAYIVTRDKKDFKFSTIKAVTPAEFLSILQQ